MPIRAFTDLVRVVSTRAGMPTVIELRRAGRSLSLTVTPSGGDGKARIGASHRYASNAGWSGLPPACICR